MFECHVLFTWVEPFVIVLHRGPAPSISVRLQTNIPCMFIHGKVDHIGDILSRGVLAIRLWPQQTHIHLTLVKSHPLDSRMSRAYASMTLTQAHDTWFVLRCFHFIFSGYLFIRTECVNYIFDQLVNCQVCFEAYSKPCIFFVHGQLLGTHRCCCSVVSLNAERDRC